MKHLFLSVIERVAARLPSAVLMLLLAVYLSPADVGMYAWMIISLTFVQASIDVPLRQISIEAIETPGGRALLRRISRLGAAFGVVLLGATLTAILLLDERGLEGPALQLAPLVAVPLLTLGAVLPVARLQASGRWDTLARSQAIAAFSAVALTLPILILTGGLVAAALQPLLAEGFNFVQCRAHARKAPVLPHADKTDSSPDLVREWWGVQAYSILGWAQGQADRVFVGAYAGAARLGGFSYAAALGRTGAEAMTNAGVNVFRAKLQRTHSVAEIRDATERATLRMLILCTAGVLAVWVVAELVLPRFLATTWNEALQAAPLLAISTIPAAVTWHMSVALVLLRRTKQALPVRALGVALGLLVAWAAVQSLTLAAFAIIARELIVTSLIAPLLGKGAPTKSVLASWALCAILATASLLASGG